MEQKLHRAMFQGRERLAHIEQPILIDGAHNETRPVIQGIDNFPPRVDQDRMPPGASPIFMLSTLRAAQYVALVLNGAGPQQYLPVRLSRGLGERGWQAVQAGLALRPYKLRKQKVAVV